MSSQINNFIIHGSKHVPHQNTKLLGVLEREKQISTTWILRRNSATHELDQAISQIDNFAKSHNLNMTRTDTYHLHINGASSDFTAALGIELLKYENETHHVYHANPHELNIQYAWGHIVENILGFNTAKVAQPYFRNKNSSNNTTHDTQVHYYPPQVATLYNFPSGNGANQTVGIIELGGGFVLSDITTYFTALNINTQPSITAVGIDGASNNPSDTTGANIEVILDIEVIASIVPNATIRVYFAPNTDQGFYDAIRQAGIDSCSAISISWGGPEDDWSSSSLSSYNTLFQNLTTVSNVTIAVAAGDNGSSDGESGTHVDFPGSSPYAISCGGTRLSTTNNTTISSEVVWNDGSSGATGGGLSSIFARPSYQQSLISTVSTHRGVPDITGNADPNSGYYLYCASEGGYITVGGTSAVAPLWSALVILINQALNNQSTCGYMHPNIYSNPQCFHDITSGSNGSYSAKVGYDLCSGLGSPNGQLIANLFSSGEHVSPPVAAFSATPLSGQAPLQVVFTDSSTNNPTSWAWTFGLTGATSTAQNPTYTYQTPGTYSVTLVASNAAGSNTITLTNYIIVQGPPLPTVLFTANKTTGKAPLTVGFTNQSTGVQTSYLWNFGDRYAAVSARTSTLQNPSHKYTVRGTYSVSLTVRNASGSNILTKNSYIKLT
jgi:kumamolisin